MATLDSNNAEHVYKEVKVSGSEKYQEMMERLSLPTSKHYSYEEYTLFPLETSVDNRARPPYNNIWEKMIDKPRQLVRQAKKALYMPASRDVAILSSMINELVSTIEYGRNYDVAGAREVQVLVSTPHLIGLYQEDILDAIEYQGVYLSGIVPRSLTKDYVHPRESIAAMAGSGWGLCSNYTDIKECEREEEQMNPRRVWTIEYTNSSLHVRLETLRLAHLKYEAYNAEDTMTSFVFNCNASLNGGQPGGPYDPKDPEAGDRYANDMFHFLGSLPRATRDQGPITDVQIMGECLDDFIGWMIFVILDETQNLEPNYFDDQPLFLAARGAYELARRLKYKQNSSDLLALDHAAYSSMLKLQRPSSAVSFSRNSGQNRLNKGLRFR